jgi:hypothetical protein
MAINPSAHTQSVDQSIDQTYNFKKFTKFSPFLPWQQKNAQLLTKN